MTLEGKVYPVTAKIHHKMMATGPFAIVGTSFNFSQSAEQNNEQILVFKDKNLVQFVGGVTEWLSKDSRASVYEEALLRKSRQQSPAEASESGALGD